jgi:hypothetical protein
MALAPVSIFFHNYYGNHEDWVRYFCRQLRTPFALFYNVVSDSMYNMAEDHLLEQRLSNAATQEGSASGSPITHIILRRSTNQGKDIGGKLVLLDAFLRLYPDMFPVSHPAANLTGTQEDEPGLFIFLHDKKSPYKAQGFEWQEKLFRIIGPAFLEKAHAAFEKDPKLGLVADIDTIRYEYDPARQTFISNNRDLLTHACDAFGIRTPDYHYVAGTMFLARAKPVLEFFRTYRPLDIRGSLEKGNITDESAGSNTHTWERLLSWLIFAQGYTIKAQ